MEFLLIILLIPTLIFVRSAIRQNNEMKFRQWQHTRSMEMEEERRKRQKRLSKQISRQKYKVKTDVWASGKLKLPTLDISLKKADKRARYLLKVLNYIKENEPKWPNPNWSKAYKDPLYNSEIISNLRSIFGNLCCYCGVKLTRNSLTLDHVVARDNGGSNRKLNLLLACRVCNSTKGTNSIGQFIISEYLAGKKFAPWIVTLLHHKTSRNLIKKLQ